MQPEVYAAIQLEWCKISNEEHRSLIYDYLTNNRKDEYGSWMEFLRIHFKIEGNAAAHLIQPCQRPTRLSSAA
jgi:hypothetical protein